MISLGPCAAPGGRDPGFVPQRGLFRRRDHHRGLVAVPMRSSRRPIPERPVDAPVGPNSTQDIGIRDAGARGPCLGFRALGIGVNSLWPRTAINTAALQLIPGVDISRCRTPEILADAAHLILTSDAKATTGNFFIDDALLAQHGVTDFERYSVTPGTKRFIPDYFVD